MWLANLLTALALLLLFYAVVFLAIHSPLFPVRRVQVEGDMTHVTREQLQYVVKNELKGTFFTLDLDKTRQAFEKLPWVRRVEVRRYWPDRLEVNVEEHRAIARWGSSALLNSFGEKFDAASNEALPVLEGPDGTEKQMVENYRQFRDALKPLGKQPTHVWLSGRRAWRIELDGKIVVDVGRDNGAERLQRFVTAYPNSLARVEQPFDYVDLRYPNGFSVKLPGFRVQDGKTAKTKPAVKKPA
ncbi:cell division protein FtsQ/DivIB [Formivibrio citricus]|nr:cell division protein FtsQ/DivIB [Formivibrio citricus]